MDLSLLKMVIADQREQYQAKFRSEKMVPRENVACSPKTDLAVAITGPRRAGKSTFALLAVKDIPHAYINFDDERVNLKAEDLNQVVEAFYSLYPDAENWIFDEIQNVQGWERFVSRIVQSKKVIITGSNSKLLSGELATSLTGRHLDARIFPFSFREYLKYLDYSPGAYTTRSVSTIKKHLEEYLARGGYPTAYKSDSGFYLALYSDILQKDILARYRPKRPQELKDLARLLLSNSGLEVSFNKLKIAFNIASANTVGKYVAYLEAAFLIFTVNRFSFKLKEQLLAPKKIYCIDTGLAATIAPSTSTGKGRLMENLVAIELSRRAAWKKDSQLCYWKDYSGHEVDFITLEGGKPKQAIQSCYDVSNPLTLEREIKSLRLGMKELRLKNGVVLTWDEEKKVKQPGSEILLIPLWKWLLEP